MGTYRYAVNISNHEGSPPSTNVFHFRTADSDGDAFNQAEADAATASIRQLYLDSAAVFAEGVRIAFPNFAIAVGSEETVPINPGADVVSTQAARNTSVLCFCINWVTASRSRRGRGRTFLGPLGQNVIGTDGNPSSTALSIVKNAAEAFVERSTGPNLWAVGVYGQQSKNIPEPKVLRDITGYTLNEKQFSVMTSRRG